ncbi:hypothetical protein FDP41_004236 [Naegleria fowleri]|uniref:Protein kinase domain-containing protein n=1 Tax=Naegleria fowleri TaxID=5763 RepID=A0A6A5BRM6_NAEFO|nr:uncharacterized protein FDP41_004236 [Naegleria fowleri]KAF0976941.1 hypothetical protein FDP41_004236 [Naegleria fowleri]
MNLCEDVSFLQVDRSCSSSADETRPAARTTTTPHASSIISTAIETSMTIHVNGSSSSSWKESFRKQQFSQSSLDNPNNSKTSPPPPQQQQLNNIHHQYGHQTTIQELQLVFHVSKSTETRSLLRSLNSDTKTIFSNNNHHHKNQDTCSSSSSSLSSESFKFQNNNDNHRHQQQQRRQVMEQGNSSDIRNLNHNMNHLHLDQDTESFSSFSASSSSSNFQKWKLASLDDGKQSSNPGAINNDNKYLSSFYRRKRFSEVPSLWILTMRFTLFLTILFIFSHYIFTTSWLNQLPISTESDENKPVFSSSLRYMSTFMVLAYSLKSRYLKDAISTDIELGKYPVTCQPIPSPYSLEIFSAGLPSSGALGNGSIGNGTVAFPSSTLFVSDPTLVEFLKAGLRKKEKTEEDSVAASTWYRRGSFDKGDDDDSKHRSQKSGNYAVIRQISASVTHTIALADDYRTIYVFGLNENGGLGVPPTDNPVPVLTADNSFVFDWEDQNTLLNKAAFPEMQKQNIQRTPTNYKFKYQQKDIYVKSVNSGAGFSIVLSATGQLFSFGSRNNMGQLGNNSTKPSQTPVLIMDNVDDVSVENDHTVFVIKNRSVGFFGSNANNQMGISSISNETMRDIYFSYFTTPILAYLDSLQIPGYIPQGKGFGVKDVVAGKFNTLIIGDEEVLILGDINNLVTDKQALGLELRPAKFVGRFPGYNVTFEGLAFNKQTVFNGTLASVDDVKLCDRFLLLVDKNKKVWVFGTAAPKRDVSMLGEITPPNFLINFGVPNKVIKAKCGSRHVVVLTEDNVAYGAGSNSYGQLGVSPRIRLGAEIRSPIVLGRNVTDIECGDFNTFLTRDDNTVRAFGLNNLGQLGVKPSPNRSSANTRFLFAVAGTTSVQNNALVKVDYSPVTNISLQTGPFQTFIQTPTSFYVTGRNYNSMFSSLADVIYSPVLVTINAKMICSTFTNTIVLQRDTNDLLLLGADNVYMKNPLTASNKKFKAIACGAYHALMIDQDGGLYSVGLNQNGQLGTGNVGSGTVQATTVSLNGEKAAAISCGAKHSMVLTETGTAYVFGDNSYGQCGISSTNTHNVLTPTKLQTSQTVKKIVAGYYHSHVMLDDGTILSFGRNDYGQLGNLEGTSSSFIFSPTRVLIPSNVRIADISSGAFHTVMLTTTGEVYAFGNNDYGQIGSANDTIQTSNIISLSESRKAILMAMAGGFHSVFLSAPAIKGYCPVITCNGIVRTSADVCNRGNGTCTIEGICSCNTGYFGSNCEFGLCFGKNGTDPTVCNGRGICIYQDTCVCNSNYTGAQCQTLISALDESTILAIALPVTSVVLLILLAGLFIAISLFIIMKKDRKKKSEERETSSGTESAIVGGTESALVGTTQKAGGDFESNLSLSMDKEMNLFQSNSTPVSSSNNTNNTTPFSGTTSYNLNRSTNSNNIRTFMNISQVSTATTLTDNGQYQNSNGGTSMLIDRFTNLSKVGSGAFGVVLKGQDLKQNNQWKAIKLIRFGSLNELNQTLREATHLLRMVHPNIVRVNDVFIDPGQQMLCMEMDFYELGDLEKFIENQMLLGIFTLPEEIVAQLIYQLCSALHYMNTDFNMIHRDVKPSNIFVKNYNRQNSFIEVVLGDFGLAKKGWRNSSTSFNEAQSSSGNSNSDEYVLTNEENTQDLLSKDAHTLLSTQLGFAGTPIYMSWESLVQGKYCFQSDVFSVGVTAYQCLTGDTETCITQLYLKEHQYKLHLKETPESVEQLIRNNFATKAPQCSQELVEIVISMLKKNPEERPLPNQVTQLEYFHKMFNRN